MEETWRGRAEPWEPGSARGRRVVGGLQDPLVCLTGPVRTGGPDHTRVSAPPVFVDRVESAFGIASLLPHPRVWTVRSGLEESLKQRELICRVLVVQVSVQKKK